LTPWITRPWFNDGSASPLLKKLPPLSRARGCRLYTADRRRLVDLWLYGGRALLGHTPLGLLKTLKNTASRGLLAPLPHRDLYRLERALEKLFPGRIGRIYRDGASLNRALEQARRTRPDLWEPFPEESGGPGETLNPAGKLLWRPFWDPVNALAFPQEKPLFIPVLPLPWMNAPETVILSPGMETALPPSDLIPPLILAALGRTVYDLIAAGKTEKTGKNRGAIELPHDRDFPLWKRQGIYILFTGSAALYENLFTRFLEGGFLLPPEPELPAIPASGLSPGETARLVSLLSFTP
jgi:hypothetical protein